jgi:two-component system, NarL family, nitrate/nitrite response regulator NarL
LGLGEKAAEPIGRERLLPPASCDSRQPVIRVLVIVGVRLYRDGVCDALARRPDIVVVGSAAGVADGLHQIGSLRPDVIVVDASMATSTQTLREFGRAAPSSRLLALSVDGSDVEVLATAEAGVAGFVTRDQSVEDLVQAVRATARGEMLCSPRHAAVLLKRVAALAAQLDHSTPADASLTAREHDILALLGEGRSNKEIASELVIEISTVKNHVHSILRKLQVQRRGEAAAMARRRADLDAPLRY